MKATCPGCGVTMDLAGHTVGEVVRCSCQALLYITVDFALDLVPGDPPAPRPSLWALAEQVRSRLAADLEQLQDYQVEAYAAHFRRLSEQCGHELHRRRTAPRREP